MSPELEELHAKKVAAIGREDYMEAQNVKLQMLKLVKLEKLARQKEAAVAPVPLPPADPTFACERCAIL